MFAAGSVKASKWGWDYKGYTVKYDASYSTVGGTVGAWSPLTLAPNGFYYALPRVWTKDGGAAANDVLCFKPGKSNNKDNKWEAGQVFLIPGSGGKRPALPSLFPKTLASEQFRFPSKGVLSHGVINGVTNGFIYFFGMLEKSYVRLRPQLDPDADPLTATEWDVINYNDTTPQIDNVTDGANGGSYYSGGVLGQDGYIYLIPSPVSATNNYTSIYKQKTIRIAPRNTSLNPTNEDVIQTGYYNASNLATCFNKNSAPRPYAYGVDSTGVELTIPSDITLSAYIGNGKSLSNAIVHPNGKIYLFGGNSKRIYILDPTKWGTSSEIYTNNNIYIPNLLTGNPNRGWHGNSYTATLEKLKTGQDPDTLKIFFALGDGNGSVTNDTTKKYTSAIAFDPVTETFDASFYDNATNEGITLMPNATQGVGPNSSSFIHFPNGHILQATSSSATGVNTYSKLLYIGQNDETKFIGPVNRNILSYTEKTNLYETYTHAAGQAGWGSSTPGISKSLGKTIYSSIWGACEITSVKGFYPNIKHFSYTDDDSAIYDIPSDLSTLPTSLWNAYFNKPR